ncbi:MAG: bacteriohemerythrin [Gammaproteobacteria bacterium]
MNPTIIKPLIEWSDEYLIGVEELDYEHRDLINRLNELHEELAHHDEKGKIEDCLGAIHVRVVAHFALEERFMRDNNFKNYAHHKKEHDDFLEVIVDFIENFRSDPELSYGDELEEQLQHWIVNHIMTSDQELATAKKDK